VLGERKPETRRRPGYRDWRSGLVSIVWVLVLAFVVVQWPAYGAYAVVAFVVGLIVWRFASTKGRER
jgi:Flp pilus assembly protein TadB